MDDIYTSLFKRIIAGRYKAETRLKEEELSDEFGISRTPVREALRQLAQDGLVQVQARRGAKVLGFTVDDVEEIYDIRKSLELQALRSSILLLNIQGLKGIRDKLIALSETDDTRKHEEGDANLHNYFIESSGKKRLIAMLNQLFRLIRSFREFGFTDGNIRKSALKAHIELIDALSIRDLGKAEKILINHIEESKRNAIAMILKKV